MASPTPLRPRNSGHAAAAALLVEAVVRERMTIDIFEDLVRRCPEGVVLDDALAEAARWACEGCLRVLLRCPLSERAQERALRVALTEAPLVDDWADDKLQAPNLDGVVAVLAQNLNLDTLVRWAMEEHEAAHAEYLAPHMTRSQLARATQHFPAVLTPKLQAHWLRSELQEAMGTASSGSSKPRL
jgi:hypothetical protein